jgi:GDPmannose 4,6-dehydratase
VLFAPTTSAARDVHHGSRCERSDEPDEYFCFRIDACSDAMVLRAEIPARS